MVTERPTSVSTGSESNARWASLLAALLGLWVLASPFVQSGAVGTAAPMWSAVAAGLAIVVLSGYGAYAIRSTVGIEENSPGELSGWLAALVGLWIAASPFVLTGAVGEGLPMWSNVVAGLVALVLAGFAGYFVYHRR